MTPRLSALHPLSWPLWLKFTIGITVGLLVFAIPAYTFVRSGVYDIGLQSASALVSEAGLKHASAVTTALEQARTLLDGFTGDAQARLALTGYLLGGVRTGSQVYLPHASQEEIAALFQSRLLNPAASSFESVRLLDRNGQRLLNATVTSTNFGAADESQSAAYRAVQAAQLQGEPSALAVSSAGAPVVEVVNTILWRDGTPIGYVVATLSNARIFFNNLRLDATTADYQAYTFVTTAQNVLIVPATLQARAQQADQSSAVSNALNGQTDVSVYTANDGQQYVGYYTLIADTPFALVTQAPLDAVNANTLEFFQVRAFVVGAGSLVLLILLVLLFNQLIVPPLDRLRRATLALADGNFDVRLPDAARGDEIGQLAASFVNMRDQVRSLVQDLEGRVAARTRDISATQEISRFAITQRDVQALMDRVVDLIAARFPNIYHAQIFLIDDEGRDAVLRASTGDAGRQLLSRGHRLGVGSLSVIGQVTQQGRLIVARDAAVSQIHRRNEFLPETRAEVAIPLRIGDTVIGALDVQSRIRDAFDEDQVNVLETMAAQIAVAIQNARLYEESVRRVAEIEESNRQATRRAWQEFMRDQRVEEMIKEAGYHTDLDVSDLRRQAIARREPVVGAVTERQTIPVAVPVQIRGQVLGAVEWEIPAQTLSEEKLELAKELANRLALSLDNARLFQQSQRATERERLVNSIAAKLTAQTSINDILQTAVREVGQALRAPQVSIRLQGTPGNGNGGTSGEN